MKDHTPPSLLPGHVESAQTRRPSRARATQLLRILAGLFLLASVGKYISLQCGHHLRSPGQSDHVQNPAYLIEAEHGAVAAENGRCSIMGVDVLKDGGNAVDAAVATTLCTGVVNMFSSGIGGGGFMTIRVPVWTIDFREAAPRLANASMYKSDPATSMFGGLAVGVPGELRALAEAHARWGSGNVSWARLVRPSARLAEGWTVDPELGLRIQMFESLMLHHPDWTPTFAPNGTLLRVGDPIARHATGGVLDHADLAGYEVKVRKALKGTYLGRNVYTTSAPASGPVLLQMLNLMERYEGLWEEGRTGLNAHRSVEAIKFGFAARTHLGDPAFLSAAEQRTITDIPTKPLAALLSLNLTDDMTHASAYYNPEYSVLEDHGTRYTQRLH
ncbi:hypothetical protein FIBSPDRAFT_864277 [Athelia psychrophila]|uniref:Gamma-glutamyltranspeptidase n=1 Tax=Athelia psychrophila TaxID=1759441 RepID=A0A166GK92_9AGAM|nr:hypothetical protein FIBSPDRAFT_864277 [Fibularhizoctonia sp. CBS 109695]